MADFTRLKTILIATVSTIASVASLRNCREKLAEVTNHVRTAWHRQAWRPANYGVLLVDGLRKRELPFYMVDPISWRGGLDRNASQDFELSTGLVPRVVQVSAKSLDLLAEPLHPNLVKRFTEKKWVFVEPRPAPDGIGINAVLNLLFNDRAAALLYEDAKLVIDDLNSQLGFITPSGNRWKSEFEVRLERAGIADSFYRIAESVVARKRPVILVLVDLPFMPRLWSCDPGKALLPPLRPLMR